MSERSATQACPVIETLEAARRRSGATQAEWARQLGITQGHYSKIVRGRARPGLNLSLRAQALTSHPDLSEFEAELLSAMRSTPRFQQLLQLLLDMHLHKFRFRTLDKIA